MSEKITIQHLARRLAEKHGMEQKDAEAFAKGMFELIEEALAAERYVKIKGLGTFKLTEVDNRESVDVNTGERIEIQSHFKVSFTPDSGMRELINKPFSHFETVILNEHTELENTETELTQEEETNEEGTDLRDDDLSIPSETDVPEPLPVRSSPVAEDSPSKKKTGISWKRAGIIVLLLCVGGWFFMFLRPGDENPIPLAMEKEVLLPKESTLSSDTLTQTNQTETLPTVPPVFHQMKISQVTLADTVEYEITGTRTSYTLQEGETLVKVAQKFYGTKDLWPYLVKHNRDLIKNADVVLVGMTLRIPELVPKSHE